MFCRSCFLIIIVNNRLFLNKVIIIKKDRYKMRLILLVVRVEVWEGVGDVVLLLVMIY